LLRPALQDVLHYDTQQTIGTKGGVLRAAYLPMRSDKPSLNLLTVALAQESIAGQVAPVVRFEYEGYNSEARYGQINKRQLQSTRVIIVSGLLPEPGRRQSVLWYMRLPMMVLQARISPSGSTETSKELIEQVLSILRRPYQIAFQVFRALRTKGIFFMSSES
jgi:hypothetical protein